MTDKEYMKYGNKISMNMYVVEISLSNQKQFNNWNGGNNFDWSCVSLVGDCLLKRDVTSIKHSTKYLTDNTKIPIDLIQLINSFILPKKTYFEYTNNFTRDKTNYIITKYTGYLFSPMPFYNRSYHYWLNIKLPKNKNNLFIIYFNDKFRGSLLNKLKYNYCIPFEFFSSPKIKC